MSDNNPTTSSMNAMAEKVEQSGKPAQDPGGNDVIDLTKEQDTKHQHNE